MIAYVEFVETAPRDSRFHADAFIGQIGKTIPWKVDGQIVGAGMLMEAQVISHGDAVILAFRVELFTPLPHQSPKSSNKTGGTKVSDVLSQRGRRLIW